MDLLQARRKKVAQDASAVCLTSQKTNITGDDDRIGYSSTQSSPTHDHQGVPFPGSVEIQQMSHTGLSAS